MQTLPPGLIVLKEFITPEEEERLINCICWDHDEPEIESNTSLKHRQVKHFGYEFLYGSNKVDVNKPLDRRIPSECDFLWNRIAEKSSYRMPWAKPDQLTVNKYEAGQGEQTLLLYV